MPHFFEEKVSVRPHQLDQNVVLSTFGILDFFQDSAATHATELGVDNIVLQKEDLSWVMTSLYTEFFEEAKMNEELFLRTWPSERKKIYAFRNHELVNQSGEFIARGISKWIIIDTKKRALSRDHDVFERFNDFLEEGLTSEVFTRREKIENPDLEQSYIADYSHIDVNRHINNVNYAKWMLCPLPSEFWQKNRLKSLEVFFLNEGFQNDELLSRSVLKDGKGLHSIVRPSDEKELAFSKSVWVSRN